MNGLTNGPVVKLEHMIINSILKWQLTRQGEMRSLSPNADNNVNSEIRSHKSH